MFTAQRTALARSLRHTLGASCGVTALVVSVLGSGSSFACTGLACMQIWSTADGGGALTVYWDYTKPVQTYFSLCVGSDCLYSSVDPGFMAPPTDPPPAPGLYRLADGTSVSIQIVAMDAGLSMNVNGQKLSQPGDAELLGIMPTIHVHPSWQILVPPNQFGNFQVSYKLTTTSSPYTDSQVYTQTVTNIQPANPTPTPTPTAAPASHCPGDCNDDGKVTVDELLRCVNMALTGNDSACPPCDVNGDGAITVDEILTAVTAALDGCPTPVPATLQMIQDTIFTPRCAIGTCHDAASATENLNLSAGAAFGQLINVPSAENPAMPRVDPGNPSNSFLLVKVQGPPPGEGSLMPLTGAPLSPDQIQLIRNWILQGANP